jgi:hypothetical protein
VDHCGSGIAGAFEQHDGVAVGLQFERPGVTTANQAPSQWSERTASGKHLFQQSDSQTQAGPDELRFRRVTEIFMGDFVGQDTAQLLIRCAVQ